MKHLAFKTFTFFWFFIFQPTNAQNTIKELAGFKYKELIVNADSTASKLPVIIAMHWMRSTPDEFFGYIKTVQKPARIILLQGTYPYKEGFSFFPVSPDNYYKMNDDAKMEKLSEEGDRLAKFIKAAVKKYPSNTKPIIVGASQGGDLSYYIGIKYNQLISLACPLLATIDNRIITKRDKKKSSPIIAFHGEDDPIVKIDVAKNHIEILKQNNFNATINTYKNLQHDIAPEMQANYCRLIDQYLK
ncbi:dienelactone hydrolase family protein [Flavobacterium enshiense]|uniref:alpha/beta hydrolase n=1 Tax=Flavobacterium enshiense TaxID=1341165 RepID=UPI00345D0E6C